MRKLTGKRAIMYSFLVIIMLLLMTIYFMTERQTSIKQQTHLMSKVIKGFEEKRTLAEEDIQRGIYIVSFRTFLSIDNIIQSDKGLKAQNVQRTTH